MVFDIQVSEDRGDIRERQPHKMELSTELRRELGCRLSFSNFQLRPVAVSFNTGGVCRRPYLRVPLHPSSVSEHCQTNAMWRVWSVGPSLNDDGSRRPVLAETRAVMKGEMTDPLFGALATPGMRSRTPSRPPRGHRTLECSPAVKRPMCDGTKTRPTAARAGGTCGADAATMV